VTLLAADRELARVVDLGIHQAQGDDPPLYDILTPLRRLLVRPFASDVRALQEAAAKLRLSPFALTMTAFALAMQELAEQPWPLVVPTLVSQRTPASDAAVGFLLSVLPVVLELAVLAERYGARCMFLATVHGHAVGAVALRRRTPDAVELCRLWVDPAHRRHGVGSLLTTWMVDEAARRGVASVVLTVLEGRDAAAAMYERLGFKLMGHKDVAPVRMRRYERTLGPAS